jgi:hypothetical protein
MKNGNAYMILKSGIKKQISISKNQDVKIIHSDFVIIGMLAVRIYNSDNESSYV